MGLYITTSKCELLVCSGLTPLCFVWPYINHFEMGLVHGPNTTAMTRAKGCDGHWFWKTTSWDNHHFWSLPSSNLVGGLNLPLWKIWKSIGWWHSQLNGKIENKPPTILYIYIHIAIENLTKLIRSTRYIIHKWVISHREITEGYKVGLGPPNCNLAYNAH